jgi:hypothetical protein
VYSLRLGMEIQTLAATCAKCELHKKDEDSESLGEVIGNYQVCANDQAGYAARNALTLKGLITGESLARSVETKSKANSRAMGEGAHATP